MINNLYIYLFKFRNYFNNQNKKIVALEKNNIIITNKLYTVFLQFLVFFNLTNLIKYIDYNYIYETDGLVFYNNIKIQNIIKLNSNMIVKFLFNNIDVTIKINKYHMSVPLYVIFNLENIKIEFISDYDNDDNIEIEVINLYTKKKNIKYYEYNIIKYNKLYEII